MGIGGSKECEVSAGYYRTPVPSDCEHNFCVVIIGDFGIGKTRLLWNLIGGNPNPSFGTRLSEYSVHRIYTRHGSTKLTLRDTDGIEERHRYSLPSCMYINKDIIILVYDMGRPESLRNLTAWYENARKMCGENTLFAVIGNDRIERSCACPSRSYEAGKKFATEINAGFFKEARVGDAENTFAEMVDAVFEHIKSRRN